MDSITIHWRRFLEPVGLELVDCDFSVEFKNKMKRKMSFLMYIMFIGYVNPTSNLYLCKLLFIHAFKNFWCVNKILRIRLIYF